MFHKLLMIDEEWDVEKDFGVVSHNFLKKIILLATQKELPFLSHLDDENENIYNITQLEQIQIELIALEKDFIKDEYDFKLLIEAINTVIKEEYYTYLKVTCLKT